MLDAVLLEWEGVLADTGRARRDALLRALTDEGVPWTAAAYDARCRGLDVHGAATVALAQAGIVDATLVDLVTRRASRAFVARVGHGFSLVPGAADFIAFAAHRARVAIVTRAGRAETELAIGLAGLADAIALVVTADDVLEPPPAPALYTQALHHLSRRRPIAAARVVALLDAAPSIQSARACGMRTLAVGAAAHVALDADAAVDGLLGLTMDDIVVLVGAGRTARPA